MLYLLQTIFDGVAGFQRTTTHDAHDNENENDDPVGETCQTRANGHGDAIVVIDFTLSSWLSRDMTARFALRALTGPFSGPRCCRRAQTFALGLTAAGNPQR